MAQEQKPLKKFKKIDRNASLSLSKPEFKSEKKGKTKTFLIKSFALILKNSGNWGVFSVKAV